MKRIALIEDAPTVREELALLLELWRERLPAELDMSRRDKG